MSLYIWDVSTNQPQRVERTFLDLESNLEEWIEKEPSILEEGLLIVARQFQVDSGRIDLLGINALGNWVVIEIKREKIHRETIAQAIDYVTCLEDMPQSQFQQNLRNHLRYKGSNLEERMRLHGWNDTIFDIGHPEIIVVGLGRDLNLERIIRKLEKIDNQINIITLELFENDGGQQLLVRQVQIIEPEEKTPLNHKTVKSPNLRNTEVVAQPPAHENSLERLFALAEKNGVGKPFKRVYDVATTFGLYPRLHKWSIMFAPQDNKRRVLICIWVKPYKGSFNIYIQSRAFAEFFPINEREAVKILNEPSSYLLQGNEIEMLIERLQKVFNIIKKANK
jgi:hypothetical protein